MSLSVLLLPCVRRCDDPLVKQCVASFTADWNVVERRYGAFHGQDQRTLQRRFASLRRTPSGVKLLPTQDYEVDMQEDTTVSGCTHTHTRTRTHTHTHTHTHTSSFGANCAFTLAKNRNTSSHKVCTYVCAY